VEPSAKAVREDAAFATCVCRLVYSEQRGKGIWQVRQAGRFIVQVTDRMQNPDMQAQVLLWLAIAGVGKAGLEMAKRQLRE